MRYSIEKPAVFPGSLTDYVKKEGPDMRGLLHLVQGKAKITSLRPSFLAVHQR